LLTPRGDEVLEVDDRKPRACPSLNITIIMFPPAGRLRSSIRTSRCGSGARGAALTVSSAPTVSDDADTPSGACADDTVLGCVPSR